MREKIVAAMSGGVDSSVAAALLLEQGYEVIGLSMQLWDYRRQEGFRNEDDQKHSGACCSLDDLADARRVADFLRIPFYVVNLEEPFEEEVVAPFVRSYLGGQTPIPCIHCNTRLKFGHLLLRAQQLGARQIATGHYARLNWDEGTRRFCLQRGLDLGKDQSYFLFELTQEQLRCIQFPVGSCHKPAIRELAAKFGLPVSNKAESQEVCFIPQNRYGRFVEDYLAGPLGRQMDISLPGAGEILSRDGKVLGHHRGFYHYTVGQRKGMGIAAADPLYVLETDATHNRVIAGSDGELFRKGLVASQSNWIAIEQLREPLRVSAKIRNRHEAAPGTLHPEGQGSVYLEFDSPQRAITPGQAAVFYQDDLVIGGGWIQESR